MKNHSHQAANNPHTLFVITLTGLFSSFGIENMGIGTTCIEPTSSGKRFAMLNSGFTASGKCNGIPGNRKYTAFSAFTCCYRATQDYFYVNRITSSLFSAVYTPTRVCFYPNGGSGNGFYILGNATHVYFFSLSKSGNSFYMLDNAKQGYFCEFSGSGNSFSMLDNATQGYFFALSKSGNSFYMLDNTTQGYFFRFYLSGNPTYVHFCAISNRYTSFRAYTNPTQRYFYIFSNPGNSFCKPANATRCYFSVIYRKNENSCLSPTITSVLFCANEIQVGEIYLPYRNLNVCFNPAYFLYLKNAYLNRLFYRQKVCPFNQAGVRLPLFESVYKPFKLLEPFTSASLSTLETLIPIAIGTETLKS